VAIDRVQSPNFIPIPLAAQSAYLDTPYGKVYEFQSIGQQGTNVGSRYRVHQFSVGETGNLVFTTSGYIDVLLLGGGGCGGDGYAYTSAVGNYGGAGGGAGGLDIEYNIPVTAGTPYSFTVGSAGTRSVNSNGGNTTFSTYTAVGGGRGGGAYLQTVASNVGASGGSGGGGAYSYSGLAQLPGSGTAGQGNSGGNCSAGSSAGGGGGFSSVGANSSGSGRGGNGGNGITINFDGFIIPMAAGGGAGSYNTNANVGLGGLADGIEIGGRGVLGTQQPWAGAFCGGRPVAPGCGAGGGGAGAMGATALGHIGGDGSNGILLIRYLVNQ
jgi:hypothetical protein